MEVVSCAKIVSSSSNNTNIVPELSEEKKSKLGQKFASIKDAFTFYNNYAFQVGFSVRYGSRKVSKVTRKLLRKEFVCHKQGGREKINANPKRKRGLTREQCMAKLAIVRSGTGFIIKQFVEVDNHVLATPRKAHFLRSHRKVSTAKRALTQQHSAANVPTCQQISILELQAGGIENIGCLDRDFYNSKRDANKMFAGHDASMLSEYFQNRQEKNSGFTFSIVKDTMTNKFKHCFWADAESRKAYQGFGDVVVFDTTYNTNRYAFIFAPFVRVNNHGQTTLLGCAFLSDENSESFVWLLNEWLAAMPGGPPKMIITDQDPAMAKAISEVMPTTVHRLCMWHILSKFSDKIGWAKHKEYYDKFRKCIWKSECPDEFDASWANALEKSELTDNGWLKSQYDIRARWIPAYVNNTFSARMYSSQRVESSHAFFKRFVSKNNSLMDFVVRFNRAVKRIRHKELKLDHKDINEHPILKTHWLLEKQMSEVYTLSIFL